MAPRSFITGRIRIAAVALAAASSLLGCRPPGAPEDVNELTRYLYREWENPDPKVMQEGVATLEKLLAQKDLTANSVNDRAWELSPLRPEDITVPEWPKERDPAKCLGTGVAREGPWPVTDHARIQTSPEQLEVEPTAVAYTRRFIEPTDPSCFVTRDCEVIRVENDVTRENALLKVTFLLKKDLRWVELPDGRFAMVGRSWTPRVFPGEKEGTAIQQSYTLDLFIGRPGDKTWRFQALFSETALPIYADPGIQLAIVTGATDEAFKRVDSVIMKRYHMN